MSEDQGSVSKPPRKWHESPHLWVSSTYFAEGLPYAVVNNIADILFKELGASLQVVGLTSLFHLPWNFKFLWGPLVDSYETKRRWLLATEVVIVALLLLLGLLAAGRGVALLPLAIGFLILGVLSATHDIAIDGFYLEGLDDEQQSSFVGYRAAAFKVAVLLVGGPIITVSAMFGWTVGLAITAGVMLALLAYHAHSLPRVEQAQAPWRRLARALLSWRVLPLVLTAPLLLVLERRYAIGQVLSEQIDALVRAAPWVGVIGIGGWAVIGLVVALIVMIPFARWRLRAARAQPEGGNSGYLENFLSFLEQPKVGVMLAFVLLYRTGESFLMKMRWPFFSDVVGVSLDFYSLVNGTIGTIATMIATILGGRLIARDGLRKWLWPFVLAQNVLNLLYMGVALTPDPAGLGSTGLGKLIVGGVIGLEHAGAGLGLAVFIVYLMRTCDPAHKAGHYAIVSALMSVSFTIAGVASGFLAEAIGFANYFGFTFLATIPSMVLIFFIPHLDGREAPPAAPE